MKIYLVGGAVRDKLLGLPAKERDWVVVGATPEQMLQQGFKPVGSDFPVFLHPTTNEEYALARTERKSGHGYAGFTFHADPSVTLVEDLKRRDLTINAMAEDADSNLIDPYNGQQDLADGFLHHVSDAFVEDPVRVLRIARFNARFAGLGFHVAPDTEALLKQMVQSGEVDHLVAERVWQETQKALAEEYPSSFFAVLHDCGALAVIFPELANIFTDDNMATLQHAVLLSDNPAVRFAALVQHVKPEAIQQLATRLRLPTDYKDLALATAQWQAAYAKARKNSAEEILEVLNRVDVWRRPERFENFLLACQSDVDLPDAKRLSAFWQRALAAAQQVDTKTLATQYTGKQLGDAIQQARLVALENLK